MPDKIFLDSNIIIYVYSANEPKKREIARNILFSQEVMLSTQTINEFLHVVTRKQLLNSRDIAQIIQDLFNSFTILLIDKEIIEKAFAIMSKHHYSYFDSLMLASALQSECSTLYSEDMHHNHVVEKKLKIINPFQRMD